jgi:hypothetical protein
MAMIAITTAEEDDVENWLLEQGAVSASFDSPEFALAIRCDRVETGLLVLQLGVVGQRRVTRAGPVDPLSQRTVVIETDLGWTQTAVVFVQVTALLALPLAVGGDGLIKIHFHSGCRT